MNIIDLLNIIDKEMAKNLKNLNGDTDEKKNN